MQIKNYGLAVWELFVEIIIAQIDSVVNESFLLFAVRTFPENYYCHQVRNEN